VGPIENTSVHTLVMQLKIVTLTGATFLLEFPQSLKVTPGIIKTHLSKQIGFPSSRISLVIRGKELIGKDVETKSMHSIFPDFSSKDFFVLMYRKSQPRKRKAEADTKGKKLKNLQRKRGRLESQITSSDSKAAQQLSHLREMRDLLRKFGERRVTRRAPSSRATEVKGDLLEQLINMGFKKEAATRALLLHRNNFEVSINWLLENSNDPDINKPITTKERQELNRIGNRPAMPIDALNDFIEINFGRNSPSDGNGRPQELEEGSSEDRGPLIPYAALRRSRGSISGTDSDGEA